MIREPSASLTAFSEGNALATSGVSKTRFVPWRYSFRYFPRTPVPSEARVYSARSSSPLPFRIHHLFSLGHHTRTDDARPGASLGMCDYQYPLCHGRSILSRRSGHGFEADERHVCSQGDEVQLFETDDVALAILHEDDIIAGFFAQVFLIRVAKPHRQRVADRVEEQLYFRFHISVPFLMTAVR